jgi:hypothetical protein
MTTRTGQCLCGAVRFVARDAEEDFGVCHCKMCQRWTGGMFAGVAVPPDRMEITGEENIGVYTSSDIARRCFCRICGSTLWFLDLPTAEAPNPCYEIALGLFDDTGGLVLHHEIFIDRKADAWALQGDHRRDTEAEYFRRKNMAPPVPTGGGS